MTRSNRGRYDDCLSTMANIFPFRAWRYDPRKVGDLTSVVTQPYDKITPQMQDRYYEQPFNLVRLVLGKQLPGDDGSDNVYTRAAETFRQWMQDGVLIEDEQPGFYVYYQRNQLAGGEAKVRKGFIGLGQLEEYGSGVVFPHERTLAGPKADRLNLLRTVRAQFESLFMLYSDPGREIDALLDAETNHEPVIKIWDEYGVEHLVWRITDGAAVSGLQQLMAEKPLIIADGHHRYETALAYRDECREQGGTPAQWQACQRTMMAFVNTESEGLTILPTHRVIKNKNLFNLSRFLAFAESHFDIQSYPFLDLGEKLAGAKRLEHVLAHHVSGSVEFGLYAAEQGCFYHLRFRNQPDSRSLLKGLSPRQQALDVAILHTLVIEQGLGFSPEFVAQQEPIAYVREFDEGIRWIDEGKGSACFFVNPTRIEQVRDIALAGEVLPQKSTDFYPKLLSGLAIYQLK